MLDLPALKSSTVSAKDTRTLVLEEGGTWYAIVDACDVPSVPEYAAALQDSAVSLYRGRSEDDFGAIAPYLIEVDEPVFDWVQESLPALSWGVFVESQCTLSTLCKHFRQFLMVRFEDRELYFRFYDPRVLPTFLQASSESERDVFLRPISRVLIPALNGAYHAISKPTNSRRQGNDWRPPFEIRKDHFAAFSASMESSLMSEICASLRQLETCSDWSDEELRSFSQRWADDARKYHIVYRDEVEEWVKLCAMHAELRSENRPAWIREMLMYPGRPGAQKIDVIRRRLQPFLSE